MKPADRNDAKRERPHTQLHWRNALGGIVFDDQCRRCREDREAERNVTDGPDKERPNAAK
jgi:hypothetical protein